MNSKSTVNTFKSYPTQYKPKPMASRFIDKFVSAPDKVPDENLVMQLFGIAASGNFSEINNFIITNNMILTVLDDQDNSLLHSVLSNTTLDQYEKEDIATILINKGVSVSGYNKNNVTPMHLAAKHQLVNIIKLLHEKGASINNRDNNGMTPAHYAMRPQNTTCIDKHNEIDKLIPDGDIRLDDEDNKNTKNILNFVKSFLTTNLNAEALNAKALLTNLKRTLLDINVNSYPDVMKYLDDMRAEINKKIASGASADVVSSQEIQRCTKTIQDELNKRLNANSSEDIATWAPDDAKEILLLPYINISDGLLPLKENIRKELIDRTKEYSDIETAITAEIATLSGRVAVGVAAGVFPVTNVAYANFDIFNNTVFTSNTVNVILDKYSSDVKLVHNTYIPDIKAYLNTINNNLQITPTFIADFRTKYYELLGICMILANFRTLYDDHVLGTGVADPTIINTIYNRMQSLLRCHNKVIDLANKISGYTYINKYFNNELNDFDAATRDTIDDLKDQLVTRINHVPTLPEISGLMQLVDRTSNVNTANSFLQLYGIKQLPRTQPMTYTNSTTNLVSRDAINPRLGYFGGTGFSAVPNIEKLFTDDTTQYVSLGIETTYVTTPDMYNYMAHERIMKSGTNINRNTHDIVFPIISSVLEPYTRLVKYSITRLILTDIYGKLNTNANLKAVVDNINQQMGTDNNNKIVMNIINQLIKKLFSRFTTNITGITAKHIVNYYYKNKMHEASTQQYVEKHIDRHLPKVDLIINEQSYGDLFEDIKDDVNKILNNLIIETPDNKMFNQIISNFKDYERNNQHKLTNDISGDICFEIDTDAVKTLIECGADFSIKDVEGNIPLNYAIDMGHVELVKTVLTSRLTINTQNTLGETPIEYITNKIQAGLSNLDMDKLLKRATKNLDTDIMEKSKYPRILDRSSYILKFVVYLLNHQLTNMELYHFNPDKNYSWTFNDHTSLYKVLDITDTGIPLVNRAGQNDEIDINKGVERLIEKNNQTMQKITDSITGMENELINLETYKNSLAGTDITSTQKKAQLTEYIRLLDIEISADKLTKDSLNTDIINLTAQLANKPAAGSTSNSHIVISKLQSYLKRSSSYKETHKSIVKLYEGMFMNINSGNTKSIKTDINSYYALWESLLSDTTNIYNDSTQLPLLCIQHFQTDLRGTPMQDLDIISKFWTHVLNRQIKDYFELPRSYEKQNYLLDAIVKIYAHVMEHTICTNYYVVLLKLVLNFVTTKNSNKLESNIQSRKKIINDTMNLILLDDNNENALLNYVMYKLPDMVVRSKLNISKHNKDPIKRTNTSKLLNDAVDIIVNNKGTTITNDDKLIKNIREYIVPYFVEYFDAYISESQNIVNKYLRHISNVSRDMEIYMLIKARSDEEHI